MTTQSGKDAANGGGDGKDAETPTDLNDELDTGAEGTEDEQSDAKLWAELDAKEGETAADHGSTKSANREADADADDSVADDHEDADEDEADESAASDTDQGKKAAKGAETTDKKNGKAAEVVDAVKELENLRNERNRLLEENRKLEQSDRSNRGRVSALQQKLDANGGGRPQQKAPQAPAKKKPFADEKGKAFVQEYPEVAAPVADALSEVHAELDELKAERTKREADAQQERFKKNETVLDAKHPEWQKTAATKEFGDWVDNPETPDLIKAAVSRNFDKIVDAKEAVFLFDAFKAFRSSQAGGDQGTQRQGKGGKPNAQDGPDDAGNGNDGKNGNGLTGKRQLQLESSQGTRSTGPGLVDGVPEDGDYEETWKAFDRLEARKERQQRSRQRA